MPQVYKRLSTVLKEAGLYRTFATMLNETDDDDIAPHAALYWYAADYHGGQDCSLYAVLSLSEYTPGAMERKCPPEYLHLYQRFEDAANR